MIRCIRKAIFGSPLTFLFEFHKPPYGGGNQFLLALREQFEKNGFCVATNSYSRNTRACLFNSFNFDISKAKRLRNLHQDVRMVHRVDGPIAVYRGYNDGTDKKIYEINNEIADATVFQSNYSLKKHLELGMVFKNPVIIYNSVNPDLFYAHNRLPFSVNGRKTRLIATSWSDNPQKGGLLYKWLEEHLDWSKYDFTFVGRTQEVFKRIKHIAACPSKQLADILRQHDIYITGSQYDPCSNSLLEALACGLPAVYLNSGGHPELVKDAGVGFTSYDGALGAIDRIAKDYLYYQSRIEIIPLTRVAQLYLGVLFGKKSIMQNE
jgi:glycosyltransferase involved in cell wall biosynthesis